MFRTPLIAALTVALLGGTAMAQPANAPPSNLPNGGYPSITHATRPDYAGDDAGPPANYRRCFDDCGWIADECATIKRGTAAASR